MPFDPFFANVVALLHFNSDFTDSTSRVWTAGGAFFPTISAIQSKFGGASLKLSQSGEGYINTPASTDFSFTGNFTGEAWLYIEAGFTTPRTVYQAGASALLYIKNLTEVWFYDGVEHSMGITLPTAVWNHVAWVRSNGIVTAYVNGIAGSTPYATSAVWGDSLFAVRIGDDTFGQYWGNNGPNYIDEFRLTKGVARYILNFTPPIAPFPDSSSKNDYYVHGGTPQTPPALTAGVSRPLRDEFNAIERGFDRLPALSTQANHAVVINGSNSGLTSTPGKIVLNGTLKTDASVQFSGGFSVTFVVTAPTTVTLPSVSGTLVTLSGPQTLTNKTLTAPGMNGIVTGTGVWNGSVIAAAFGGTGLSTYIIGDIFSSTGGAVLSTVADVAAGSYLRSAGAALPIWSTLTLPNASAQGDLFISTVANQMTVLAKDTNATRYLSNTGASNNPAWAQVNLVNGVAGNLPVTRLNGGTFASSTSLWRGDGAWGSIPGNTDIFSGTQVFSSPGLYSWTVPVGITRILVWLWGGGGGGCGGVMFGQDPGNIFIGTVSGPNGYHSTPCIAFLTVTPGSIVTITVGAGGSGGPKAIDRSTPLTPIRGGNGADSTVAIAATTLTAKGGLGGGRDNIEVAFTYNLYPANPSTYDHQTGGGDGPQGLGTGGDVNSPGVGGTAGTSGTFIGEMEDGNAGNNGACIIYY